MLFDMSETGISNLVRGLKYIGLCDNKCLQELDFIRFFITCFRQYYPGLLGSHIVMLYIYQYYHIVCVCVCVCVCFNAMYTIR